jgi:hypothetical protein
MDLTTFLILFIIILVLLSVGFMIPEVKYKIAYFLILCLFGLTVLNVYLSIVYYIQLRNDPGIPGDIGAKGPKGVKGMPGKCSFSEKCNIENPRNKILNIANTMYSEIPIPCLDNPTLERCNNKQDILEQAIPIKKQIDMLEQIAYSTKMAEEDFLSKISVCVQDSNNCMEESDFN